jgi:hypothetical protein
MRQEFDWSQREVETYNIQGMPRPGSAVETVRGESECRVSEGTFAMDAELKRDARGVIDRIVQLRDSL